MNRSHSRTRQPFALVCIASVVLVTGAAGASDGEHTDWPDFPDGDLLSFRIIPERDPTPREIRFQGKRPPVFSLDPNEHTDWPDFPDGEIASFLDTLGIPTDPNAMPIGTIGAIPSLDELLSPFNPGNGFAGIATGNDPGIGLTTVSAIPAPGGAVLMLALAAAATRRRR